MEQVYVERLQLNPGAAELVAACKAAGLKVLLVSGGFTFFTDRIRDRLGIDFTRSNVLEIESGPNCGQLTGRMVDQPWGDICDGAEKRKMLLETCAQLGISPKQAIAMGDGANDLPMMGEAGLSVAYHAKPKVREQAMVAINEGGLDRPARSWSARRRLTRHVHSGPPPLHCGRPAWTDERAPASGRPCPCGAASSITRRVVVSCARREFGDAVAPALRIGEHEVRVFRPAVRRSLAVAARARGDAGAAELDADAGAVRPARSRP